MKSIPALFVALLASALSAFAQSPASVVPAHGPRTMVVAGQHDAFRAYCTTGAGAEAFALIKATVGLRVPAEEELEGLDVVEHGSPGYGIDTLAGAGAGQA